MTTLRKEERSGHSSDDDEEESVEQKKFPEIKLEKDKWVGSEDEIKQAKRTKLWIKKIMWPSISSNQGGDYVTEAAGLEIKKRMEEVVHRVSSLVRKENKKKFWDIVLTICPVYPLTFLISSDLISKKTIFHKLFELDLTAWATGILQTWPLHEHQQSNMIGLKNQLLACQDMFGENILHVLARTIQNSKKRFDAERLLRFFVFLQVSPFWFRSNLRTFSATLQTPNNNGETPVQLILNIEYSRAFIPMSSLKEVVVEDSEWMRLLKP